MALAVNWTRQTLLIAGLILTQTADIVTTLYGLSLSGITERNPVAIIIFDTIDPIFGIIFVSVLSLGVVILVTESAADWIDHQRFTPNRVRMVGYLPPTAISTVAVTNNIFVILIA